MIYIKVITHMNSPKHKKYFQYPPKSFFLLLLAIFSLPYQNVTVILIFAPISPPSKGDLNQVYHSAQGLELNCSENVCSLQKRGVTMETYT